MEYTICVTSSSGVIKVVRGETPAKALKAANTASHFVNARQVDGDTVVNGKIMKTGNRVEFIANE
jgi:hypothetical protein